MCWCGHISAITVPNPASVAGMDDVPVCHNNCPLILSAWTMGDYEDYECPQTEALKEEYNTRMEDLGPQIF